MIKVLDNVYDLVTLNMEQRFSERVALRFYDKETDEVTAVHYKDYARDIRRAVSYFQSTIPDIKGKKICLLNKNCYEYAVNTFGIILAGGVLVYGIPEFRLPKAIVQKEVDGLKAMGVKVETNTVVGRTITIDELMEENGFEAVFIGSGAGLPMFMHIPGENLCGVYSANEFLTRINLMKAYREDSDTPIMDLKGKKVAVVGGGDTACEEATYLASICRKVYMIVRKPHLRASKAMQERVFNTTNIEVMFNHNTAEVLGDESGVTGALLRCNDGKEVKIDIAGFFLAIGHHPNTELFADQLTLDAEGYIKTEAGTSKTNIEGVFAAGDVRDPHYRQAITAAASGCIAAIDCERFILSRAE